MRRGFGGEIKRAADGRVEAVNLGSDYCAEHEQRADDLAEAFGLDAKAPAGVGRRMVRQLPKTLVLDAPRRLIVFDKYGVSPEHVLDELGRVHDDEQMAGAWDKQSFAVMFADSDQGRADMADLWAAFGRKDVALLFANTHGNPFTRAGLVLAIASRLPGDLVEDMARTARDLDALRAAAVKTGIEKRIKAASRWGARDFDSRLGFVSLTPRWKDDTRREVVFLLNPSDQRANKYGTFSVADLDAWIAGEGPVPAHPGKA